MTIKQYLNQNYDYQLSFIGPIVGIMFGFIIFFAGLAIVCLKFVNFVSLLACCLVLHNSVTLLVLGAPPLPRALGYIICFCDVLLHCFLP